MPPLPQPIFAEHSAHAQCSYRNPLSSGKAGFLATLCMRMQCFWGGGVNLLVILILQVNEKFFELKGTYRDCRKSTGNKLEYWYT